MSRRTSDPPPGFDPYKTLQVDPEADPEVVQAAYRRLAQKFHPDRAPGDEAAARMIAINTAWEILGDPERRRALDRQRELDRQLADASTRGAPRPPDAPSSDWTSGRSTTGGGYDPTTMRAPDGHGAAGPPPGNPSGTVLDFGRYAGWSLGEIARRDAEYIEWLDRAPIGRAHRDEIDVLLRRLGRRRGPRAGDRDQRRGLFRR